MKKRNKKVILFTGLGIVPLSIFTFASCTAVDSKAKVDYDFGLATDPINNLNYVKYKSMDKILPSLVDPYIKNGPSSSLKSLLGKKSIKFSLMESQIPKDENGVESSAFSDFFRTFEGELAKEDGYGMTSSSFYDFDAFNLTGGLASPTIGEGNESTTMFAFRNPKNQNNYSAVTGFVNAQLNQWSNKDFMSAQDLRDYLEYILDLNNGSQKLDEIKKWGIESAERFVDAQKAYSAKFNKNYVNPWGRRKYILNDEKNDYIQDPSEKVWQSQTFDANNKPIDIEEVNEIKNAALNFGFFTGQLFLDYSNKLINDNLNWKENVNFKIDATEVQNFTIKEKEEDKGKVIKLVPNAFKNPYQKYEVKEVDGKKKIVTAYNTLANSENSFTLIFDKNKTPGISYLVSHVLTSLYPVNRKYIETEAGGFDNFGTSASNFLTGGPFKINPEELVLGPQGQIILHKEHDYFDAVNTISNKIKIFFSSDKNTNATFFEDGYISQTYIPANKLNSYWADPSYRDYLNKNQGYGTLAFGFNLDFETNGSSYLQDQDLRNAIYYAVNRSDVLKFVGWDFSFPVTTWTSYGQYKTSDGTNLELYFESMKTKAKNNKEFVLQNYDFLQHTSKAFTFEKTSRRDLSYDVETAKFYIERFKAKYPDLQNVTLKFLNNSTDEHKKAGTFLKEALDKAFDGFVILETKSLPENTYASFIEEGKYDIIYQNYDKLGGASAHDNVAVFFKRDEIDSLTRKTIGFKDNPVGSYTYGDYVASLVLEKTLLDNKPVTETQVLSEYIKEIENAINENSEWKAKYDEIIKSQSSYDLGNFITLILNDLTNKLVTKNAKIYNSSFIRLIIEYLVTNNSNIKLGRIKKAYINYVTNNYSVKEIADLTRDTANRLNFEDLVKPEKRTNINLWEKFIELALVKKDESLTNYTDRINSFFSANFSSSESKLGWNEEIVMVLIGQLEKVIRDSAIVVPLMEVDTNWEISRVGGVDGLYRFALQYAYDVTNPPKAGLPRKVK
ncbi:peptide ABC transporter substrate-binding protein [Mesomycoplasma lagogenitalium]|uniref:Peptide ABC transporter substrate-binding protein n=1 Tax=Mesomycoplasma lagogenitalium TaxID=171286 RepID=A0ABY8LY04_9BACT|nr:peptide ABC transporter substrate-binding protein [Mesomycoplasma lagogenitalium]WGI37017.1 peptide ABC transporter substrate-binding protein [Mesomycoplasma lagogenitalium]